MDPILKVISGENVCNDFSESSIYYQQYFDNPVNQLGNVFKGILHIFCNTEPLCSRAPSLDNQVGYITIFLM